jgi:Flp pilus assembly protein TadG
MLRTFRKTFSQLTVRDRRGGVMIEFAFAMPILILLLLGGVELARYMLLHQKLDRTAMTVSDLVARVTSVDKADLDTVLNAAYLVMSPFDLTDQGVVIVSSVRGNSGSGTPEVQWQRCGAGNLTATSEVGTPGSNATISNPNLVTATDGIVVGETFFHYEPWFIKMIPSTTIHHIAVFRPRLSAEVTCTNCSSDCKS